MKSYKVLLVDDEQVSREYIGGFPVWRTGDFVLQAEARNAKEAIGILERMPVDIALLDVFMPEKNGVALSGEIRERYPDVSMLAVSSYDDYDYVREILRNGAHDYILKHRLNNEILTKALYTIVDHRLNKTTRQPGPRDKVRDWLFADRICPFSAREGKLAVAVFRAQYIHDATPKVRESVVNGILHILDESDAANPQRITVHHAPGHFVQCALYRSTMSESEMRSSQYYSFLEKKSSIQTVYGLRLEMAECPAFSNYDAFPSYVRHLLQRDEGEQAPQGVPSLALTIAQRKLLLSALESRDAAALKEEIAGLYGGLASPSSSILVTRELLDIIDQAAREYGVELDFLHQREDLLHWAGTKSNSQLAMRVSGLYCQVIAQTSEPAAKYSRTVETVIAYLRQNYASAISLRDAAGHAHVNSSYLSRQFHRETGMHVVEYLNRIRVDHAKKTIADGRYSLKEIAAQCGFSRYNYFFRVFKEYEGVTPGEYRRE